MRIVVLVGLLLLAGCGSDPKEVAASYRRTCAAYGFQPGTDAFAACMMRLDLQSADHAELARRDLRNTPLPRLEAPTYRIDPVR